MTADRSRDRHRRRDSGPAGRVSGRSREAGVIGGHGAKAQVRQGAVHRDHSAASALSVVMVYSASAVDGAGALSAAPTLFLTKQGMWAVLGIADARRRDADRLPHLPRAGRSSGRASALVGARRSSSVLFSPPVNGARRWFGVGGIGVQPSELAKLAAIFFIAALLERRMHRIDEVGYSLLPIGIVVCRLVGLILLEPDFGTSMSLVADRRGDGVRRRAQLRATSSAPLLAALPTRRTSS